MDKLNIYCDQFDFSAISRAFEGEFSADAPLAAEVVFVSAEEIRALNAHHRGNDSVTDVLSFPALDDIRGRKLCRADFPYDLTENGEIFIGSIAVCEERAKAQAEEYGHSYRRELHYLVVHGLCHLLGYDHIIDDDRAEMRAKEERILTRMGITRND